MPNSDTAHFREAAATPGVRLFELPGSLGHARVVEGVRRLPGEESVREALGFPPGAALAHDPRREALLAEGDSASTTCRWEWSCPGARTASSCAIGRAA
jgi:hypothetical protein